MRPLAIEIDKKRTAKRAAIRLLIEHDDLSVFGERSAARIAAPFAESERQHGRVRLTTNDQTVTGFRLCPPFGAACQWAVYRMADLARNLVARSNHVGKVYDAILPAENYL